MRSQDRRSVSTNGTSRIAAGVCAASLLAACGASGSSATPVSHPQDKAKFCLDTASLNRSAAVVGTPDTASKSARLLVVFKGNRATLDHFVKVAPNAIRSDARLLAETINAAVKANSLSGLSQAAGVGQRVADYCGQNADGTRQ
jgi:hypothetical protein